MTVKSLAIAADQVAATQMLIEPEFRVKLAALNWSNDPWAGLHAMHQLVNEMLDLRSGLPGWRTPICFYGALQEKKALCVFRPEPSALASLCIDPSIDPTHASGRLSYVVIYHDKRCHPDHFDEPFGYQRVYISKDEIRRDTFEKRIVEATGQEAGSRAPYDLTALTSMYRTMEAIHLPSRMLMKKQLSFRKRDIGALYAKQFVWPIGYQRKTGHFGEDPNALQANIMAELNAELCVSYHDHGYYSGRYHAPSSDTKEKVGMYLSKRKIHDLLYSDPHEIVGTASLGQMELDLASDDFAFFKELHRKLHQNDAAS